MRPGHVHMFVRYRSKLSYSFVSGLTQLSNLTFSPSGWARLSRSQGPHMHTLKPLDGTLVDRLVANCGAIVTAEDHNVIGGLGGAVAEHLTANSYAPLERVGVQDRFGESGQADEMLEVMQISAPYIAEAAKRAVARK